MTGWLYGQDNASSQSARDSSISPLSGQKIDVLLLDDDCFDRVRLRRYIAQAGLRADIEEASCLSALDLALRTRSYDIFLLDYRLARECGFEALARLRDCSSNHAAGVIMVSGFGAPAIAVEAMRRGCDAFIRKAEICPLSLGSAILIAQIAAQTRLGMSAPDHADSEDDAFSQRRAKTVHRLN